ncbi:MAG: hypothetical protein LBH54_04685 [Clostridiales bacterium]|jgi:hypothetical protein|nr:hypothetical protein [Clostridiales bacterium]
MIEPKEPIELKKSNRFLSAALPQAAALLTAVVVLIYIFSVPIGVADGGGQYQTVERMGLRYAEPPSDGYFAARYGVSGKPQPRDTRAVITAFAARYAGDSLDVRRVAAIYGVLFLLGIWLAVKSGERADSLNWAAAVLCALIFTDIGYTAYFNTLYGEGAVLTTFLLAAALLLLCHKRKAAPVYLVAAAVLASTAFAFCGTLQAWAGAVLGLCIARLAAIARNRAERYTAVAGGAAVVLLSVAFALTYQPADYSKNLYHAVFLGTAKHESVARLGLDPALDALKGSFYSAEAAEQYHLDENFYAKINYAKIAGFYLTRPGAFFKELDSAVKNAYTIRPTYLGNYTKERGRDGDLASGFSLYSTLKSKFIPNTMTFTAVFFAIYFGMLLYIYRTEKEKRPIAEVLLGLGAAALLCLKLPAVLTGGYEIGRALFTYNLLFDSMLIASVVAGGRYMAERRGRLRKKYGAEQ